MTDLDKLINTFGDIGVEYNLAIYANESIVAIRSDGYRQDFIFMNGKFIRLEIY